MNTTTRKRPTTTASLSNQSPANYNAIKNTCKRGIVLLALWGLITPKGATAILKALGVTNA